MNSAAAAAPDTATTDTRAIVDRLATDYARRCQARLGEHLEALYLFGSYAFGKISLDIPDINFLLLLKEGAPPDVFRENGRIVMELCEEFKDVATVMPEARPNRYIYPTVRGADLDITLCTQYARMEDRHGPIPFGWGWVLQGTLRSRKLLFGLDALADVHQPAPTTDYIRTFFPATFSHIWLPLERAPLQYRMPEDSRMLLHEAHKVAQMAAIGFGVPLALRDDEREHTSWVTFAENKHLLIDFYDQRYDAKAARDVALMLEVRERWRQHRHSPDKALAMYKAAVDLCSRVKAKYADLVRAHHH
jgi:hypothetical protein